MYRQQSTIRIKNQLAASNSAHDQGQHARSQHSEMYRRLLTVQMSVLRLQSSFSCIVQTQTSECLLFSVCRWMGQFQAATTCWRCARGEQRVLQAVKMLTRCQRGLQSRARRWCRWPLTVLVRAFAGVRLPCPPRLSLCLDLHRVATLAL